jgi:hypothetical protein
LYLKTNLTNRKFTGMAIENTGMGAKALEKPNQRNKFSKLRCRI